MKREERKIYCKCIAIMAAYIVSAVYFYTMPAEAETVDATVVSKKAVFTDDQSEVDNFTADDAEIDLRAVFGDSERSGMPCENPEAFERWLETYESQTSEEEIPESISDYDERAVRCEDSPEARTEISTEAETYEAQAFYSVDGQVLNPELQAYLYQRLADYQLEWFMPYSIMICYQESHFDQYNVSDDGLDYGLLQFRKQFWDWSRGDIFDPYAQIDVFVELMANRANAGCDLYEMISRHMQSDYGSYNHDYVATVLSHERGLAIIGN